MKTPSLLIRGVPFLLAVLLSFTAVNAQPVADVYVSYLDFDSIFVGQSQYPSCFRITNNGDEALVFTMESSDPSFPVYQTDAQIVLPGESVESCVGFKPQSVGLKEETITINTNDPANSVFTFTVTGIGLDPPLAQNSIEDTLSLGENSTKQLLLRNTIMHPARYVLYALDDEYNFEVDYIKFSPVEYYISRGNSETVEVNFDASDLIPGTYTGHIYVYMEPDVGDNFGGTTSIPFQMVVLPGPLPSDFILTNARTGEEIQNSRDTIVFDVANPDAEQLTIRYKSTSGHFYNGVRFILDGVLANEDRSNPYLVNGWLISKLNEGFHTLNAEEFFTSNGDYYVVSDRSVVLHVINSARITDFDVVNAEGVKLMDIENGSVIDMGKPGFSSINIIANTSVGTVKSVRFAQGNTTSRIDNRAPYALRGNTNGDTAWNASPGNYTLTATPYVQYYGWGPKGIPLTVNFTVVKNSSTTSEARTASAGTFVPDESSSVVGMDTWSVYPVPVVRDVTIELSDKISGEVTFSVMDMQGQVVYVKSGPADIFRKYSVSKESLGMNRGIYFVVLQQNSGIRHVKKIVSE